MYDEFEEEYENDELENDGNIKITLPTPHEGQQRVLDSTARFKVLLCGRRWGKSLVAQIVTIKGMLNKEKIAYVVPEWSLAKDFFGQLLDYLPQVVIKTYNKSDFYIELVTGGTLKFFSGENLDSFRGRKFHKVIIDEAAKIPDLQTAWATAIRPTLTDYRGSAMFISTPKGMNAFYAMYKKGVEGEGGFQSWHFTSYNNPYLPKGEVDAMRDELTEAQFREEILAEPMADGNNPFGIENINKNIIGRLSIEPTVIFAVDVASHLDWTVCIGLDMYGNMTHYERYRQPWEITYQRIENLPKDILKVVDATGVGATLFERLQQNVQNIRGFVFTTSSKPAIINQLINDVQKGTIKYNEAAADEMKVFEAVRTPQGYIKFQAQRGFHDDIIAALAICNHYRHEAWASKNWKLYTV